MRRSRYSYKQLTLSGLELFGLLAISGLISLFFPQWIPKATINPTQREWASVFSALSLLACGISLRAFGSLTKAYATDPMQWRASNGPTLKWASMCVDAAAFFWSMRACTNRDTTVATIVIGLVYVGFPAVLKRFSADAANGIRTLGGESYESGERYARIVVVTAVVGLICVLISGGITEL